MKLGVLEQVKSINETVTQKRFSYGLDEISELTGLSTAFLRKLARAGTLKTRKFGARRMVLDADLQEFLKGENKNEK
jgi:excisionase family DNA binding protein